VYRVKHRFLGRQAMKVFKHVGMNFEDIQEMLFEAILLSRISHPNIVRVFNADVLETPQGKCGYFTMENVAGGSLDKFRRSYGGRLVPISTASISLNRCVVVLRKRTARSRQLCFFSRVAFKMCSPFLGA
jgi:serine/threonine-protein kinase